MRKRRVETHTRAARTHERAGARHDQAAAFWSARGDTSRELVELQRAEFERAAAAEEHRRADQARREPL